MIFAKCEGNFGEFSHVLIIADIGKKKIRNVVRKTSTKRRKICLLKDVKIWKRLEEKVIELTDAGILMP